MNSILPVLLQEGGEKRLRAEKQLSAASQDRIKRIILPVEQTAGTTVSQSRPKTITLTSTATQNTWKM